MAQGERRDWLLAAWDALSGIPADLLERGCRAARLTADHPAKIVPAIISEVQSTWERRRELSQPGTPQLAPPRAAKKPVMDRRGEPMTAAETAELNATLERLGATARYREDGSRYVVSVGAPA